MQLTATPASGSRFVDWSGDVTSVVNPLLLTLTENTVINAINATFAVKDVSIFRNEFED